jgi:hypothetical protein
VQGQDEEGDQGEEADQCRAVGMVGEYPTHRPQEQAREEAMGAPGDPEQRFLLISSTHSD